MPSAPALRFSISSSLRKHLTLFTPLVAQTSDWPRASRRRRCLRGQGDEPMLKLQYYSEPPLEAKLFIGNFAYDMDSEKLATLFDQAAVVKVAEVIYNWEMDQSRRFGFIAMSMVEVAEQATEMLHCNGV